METPYKVYVFDAYGTLFDVHSAVARHRSELGVDADALSELWRTKQLEYAWTRSLMGAYRDFSDLTADALDVAAARFGGLPPALRAALLDAYRTLASYPDVVPALTALRQAGAAVAILSNGTPAMLQAAVDAAGIGGLLDAVLSVDEVGTFKTDPRAYQLVGRQFGAAAAEVSFQSSNRWDIAGAAAFGFRTVWINRSGSPDEYPDLPPAVTLSGLDGLFAV